MPTIFTNPALVPAIVVDAVAMSDVNGLIPALAEKAATEHEHDPEDVQTLEESLAALDAHAASTSNPHSVTKAQVGLGNVDNTADAGKPVSTAQATAIATAKSEAQAHAVQRANHTGTQPISTITGLAEKITELEEQGGGGVPANHEHGILQTTGLINELASKLEIPIGITISGSLTPNATGALKPGPPPAESASFVTARSWSTDGAPISPVTGNWVRLWRYLPILGISGTLDELAPPENYTASNDRNSASQISIQQGTYPVFSTWTTYWLYDDGVADPYWVALGDGDFANRGAEVLATGKVINSLRSPTLPFTGGKLAEWIAGPDVEYGWVLQNRTDNVANGLWYGRGKTVDTIQSWTPSGSGVSGTPALAVQFRRLILPEFADDAAAIAGNLLVGDIYFDGTACRTVQMPVLERTTLQGPPLSYTGADSLVLSGVAFDPAITGPLARLDTYEGKPRHGIAGVSATSVYWTGTKWLIHHWGKQWESFETVPDAYMVKLWTPVSGTSATGNPTVESLENGTLGMLGQKCYFGPAVYECIFASPQNTWRSLMFA